MQKRASILKMPKKAFKKMLGANLALCAAIVILTLTVNIFLTVLRTEGTHSTFLIINIISDTAMAWFVYTYAETVLLPRYRTYALFKKAERAGERVSGIFVELGSKQRYEKKDCVTVHLSCGSETRKVFILENTFENLFRSGSKTALITADNIAVLYEAEE